MRVALLDVNVLVALFDPAHLNHDDAHFWFAKNRRSGWASCPLTINGCVRVLSNPAYKNVTATATEVMSHVRTLCSARDHHFWPDSVSLLDESLVHPRMVAGHQKITDIYLLALASRNSGKLVTFDRSIPVKAVTGAAPECLELIGSKKDR
ncbi:MAG: domain family protein [Bryobacterales bacterium]|nr:domain family protein [Bryobacterales bacterium]